MWCEGGSWRLFAVQLSPMSQPGAVLARPGHQPRLSSRLVILVICPRHRLVDAQRPLGNQQEGRPIDHTPFSGARFPNPRRGLPQACLVRDAHREPRRRSAGSLVFGSSFLSLVRHGEHHNLDDCLSPVAVPDSLTDGPSALGALVMQVVSCLAPGRRDTAPLPSAWPAVVGQM